MPPPPSPCARSRLFGQSASHEKTSPYFSREIKDLCTTATRSEASRTSQSRSKWNNGEFTCLSKEAIPSSSHHESVSPAHGTTPKLPTLPVQLKLEQSVQNLESVGMYLIRSDSKTMPTDKCRQCSLSDDEEEKRIHAEVSIEKRGFRSAKSLERSIVKRRKLKG